MANSPDFVVHALELLSGVGPVEARAMFGGHGVYARGVMFGLLDDDELFLKTDAGSRPRFVEGGRNFIQRQEEGLRWRSRTTTPRWAWPAKRAPRTSRRSCSSAGAPSPA